MAAEARTDRDQPQSRIREVQRLSLLRALDSIVPAGVLQERVSGVAVRYLAAVTASVRGLLRVSLAPGPVGQFGQLDAPGSREEVPRERLGRRGERTVLTAS